MLREEFDALTETGKHKAICTAERRAEEAESKLALIWRHLKSPIIDLIKSLPFDEWDELLEYRIKQGGKN